LVAFHGVLAFLAAWRETAKKIPGQFNDQGFYIEIS
jgi:hypothetical protein